MPFDVPVEILAGPDVSPWRETAWITRVEFTPSNFFVRHTKEGKRPDSGPAQHVPGWGNGADDPGDIQWTLYVVIHADGRWVTTPCILFHPQDPPTLGVHRGHEGAPFSTAARNWYYQSEGMAGRQPGPGDRIGLMAVAGALRGLDVRAVEERSPIAWVTVPKHDTGVFTFDAPPAPVPVDPGPPPVDPVAPVAPVDPGDLNRVLQAIVELHTDLLTRASKDDLMTLRKEVITAGQAIGAALASSGASTPASTLTLLANWFRRRP